MKYIMVLVVGVAWGLSAAGCDGSGGGGGGNGGGNGAAGVGAGADAGSNAGGNAGGNGATGGAGGTVSVSSRNGELSLSCSDLFDQSVLQTYSIDISADELSKMTAEFNDIQAVLAGTPEESYHPITLHFGSETVSDAFIRLKGQSSWVDTVTFDQPHPKMQFVIAVDQIDSKATFHGVGKIVLDMPRSDWTFLNERLSNAWFRQIGILAPCANSAKLYVNGAYYGLYVSEEDKGQRLVDEFFPGNSTGDLFKGGEEPETNKASANLTRLRQFWAADDLAAVQAIVDVPGSVLEWAAEAVLDDADGYYGGSHNFLIYDLGAKGYTWLPSDVDSTIEWMAVFTKLPYQQHPIFWWEGRPFPQPPGQDYLVVMNDPASRALYTDAIATQLQKWSVSEVQGWINDWSQQIADAVDADPNKWATSDEFRMAVATAGQVVAERPPFLQSFVACEHGMGGADQDGDGYKWCDDCRDDDPSVHPGAPEICGNGIDDNCNGLIDEGCPAAPAGGGAAAPDASAAGD